MPTNRAAAPSSLGPRDDALSVYAIRVARLAAAESCARAADQAPAGRRVVIAGLRYHGLLLTRTLIERRPCRTFDITLTLAQRNYTRAVSRLPPSARAIIAGEDWDVY